MHQHPKNRSLAAWLVSFFLMMPLISCSNSNIDMAALTHPLPPCPNSPNCVRTQFSVEVNSAEVIELVQQTITQMKANSLTVTADSAQINSVFRIPVFGWLDDFDVAVEPRDGHTEIFVRSASRVGYSDLGVNKRRVQKFIRLFNQKISA